MKQCVLVSRSVINQYDVMMTLLQRLCEQSYGELNLTLTIKREQALMQAKAKPESSPKVCQKAEIVRYE